MEIPVIIAVFAVVLHAWWQDRRISELEEHMTEHCFVLHNHADAIYGEEDDKEQSE